MQARVLHGGHLSARHNVSRHFLPCPGARCSRQSVMCQPPPRWDPSPGRWELISWGLRTLRRRCVPALAEARGPPPRQAKRLNDDGCLGEADFGNQLVSKLVPSKKEQRSAPFAMGIRTHRTCPECHWCPLSGPCPWPSLLLPPCLAHSLALRFTVNLHGSLLGMWILPDSGDRCC